MTDPTTGQTICSCQYDAHILNYQRLIAAAGLPFMYPPAAAAAAAAAYGATGGTPGATTPNGSTTGGAPTGATAGGLPGPPPSGGGPPGATGIPGLGGAVDVAGAFLPLTPEQLQASAPFFPPPVSVCFRKTCFCACLCE